MNIKYKKIPKTSKKEYISGYEALNIKKQDGTVADWHPLNFWLAKDEKDYINLYKTNDILGDEGIEYRNIDYTEDKVHVANFPRAIADLIYYGDEKTLSRLRYMTNDFLSKDEELETLKMLLKINDNYKDISEFLMIEFTRYFRKGIVDEIRGLSNRKN